MKVNWKTKAKRNLATTNAKVPGAAQAAAPQSASHIAPTFVQVTTAHMLKQQNEAKGFHITTSKAQNRKETGMPRRGNTISQASTTNITVIRFGRLEDWDKEASLLHQHPSSFVEAAQHALNHLSKHAPPPSLKAAGCPHWTTLATSSTHCRELTLQTSLKVSKALSAAFSKGKLC